MLRRHPADDDEDDLLLSVLCSAAVMLLQDDRGDKTGLSRDAVVAPEEPEADDPMMGAADADAPPVAARQVALHGRIARMVQTAAMHPEAFRRRFRVTVEMFTWIAETIKDDVCYP